MVVAIGALLGASTLPADAAVTPTTITLTPPAEPTPLNQQVYLYFTIAGSDTPTGIVTIRENGAPVASTPANGTFVSFLATVGTHVYTARYSGDVNNGPSTSSPVSVVVTKSPVDSISISGDRPMYPGRAAEVEVGAGYYAPYPDPVRPTGDISVYVDDALVGTAPASGGEVTLPAVEPGTHTLRVEYPGDANFLPGPTRSEQWETATFPTRAYMFSSTGQSQFSCPPSLPIGPCRPRVSPGAPVTYTISIFHDGSGSPLADPPAGNATFFANRVAVATVPVVATGPYAATATWTTSWPVGIHSVTASYAGDGWWRPADAGVVTDRVAPPRTGYWMLGAGGTVYGFGEAANFGSANVGGATASKIEPAPSGDGYWIVDTTGRVHAFGDARHYGSVPAGAMAPGESATAISATPTGMGYWVFTSAGRVLTFGNALDFGSMIGVRLNGPIVGSIATPSGRGYYMVGSDGGIFAFGDAVFHGSTGGIRLNQPVLSLVPTASGRGYWLVASDGGIFAFGDAGFRGSLGGIRLNAPVRGMVRYGDGYLMVGSDGGIFSFSTKPFLGSLGGSPPARPVVGIASLAEE